MPIPFLNSINLTKNQVENFCIYNLGSDPTGSLTASGDYGYLWLNTAGQKTIKWWDGANIRSIIDSTNIGSYTSGLATDLAGGSAGQIVYQQGNNDTNFVTAGTAGQVLSSNGTNAPSWLNQSSLSVGSATNIVGGSLGSIPVQTGVSNTNFLNVGTAGQVITSNGVSPQYVNQSTLSVGSAVTAGSVLNALTAGAYLTSSGTYNGSASRTFDVDATSTNTPSKVVVRDASGNFSSGTITATRVTGLSAPSTGSDAANRDYVDGVAQGLDIKASCLVASTSNITLSNPGSITIDGISSATYFTAGSTRILVKDQSASAENGIYIWQGSSSAMTRSDDANTWDELVGAFTFIESGTANANSGWVCTSNPGGTLGTTAVTWAKFSQAGSYTQGRGIVLDGSAFNFAQNTDYTAGRIPFASSTTAIGFNANLHWDNSNSRLGIGTSTPGQKLDVDGNIAIRTITPGNRNIVLTDETSSYTGSLLIQAGGGSAAYGGGIVLYGHSHATYPGGVWIGRSGASSGPIMFGSYGNGPGDKFLQLDSGGVCTWYDGAGGTRMTLNATGLGIGATPSNGIKLATYVTTGGAPASSGTTQASGSLRIGASSTAGVMDMGTAGSYSWIQPCNATNLATNYNLVLNPNGGALIRGATAADTTSTDSATMVNIGNFAVQNAASSGTFLAVKPGAANGTVDICADARSGNYPNLRFFTGSTTQMTLDSSGNLGLGVTPSAWASGWKALDVGGSSSMVWPNDNSALYLLANAYYNGTNFLYKKTANAGSYTIANGQHQWSAAPSGTAGNAISFTQAMTLDPSGNLLLGITSGGGARRLTVYGNSINTTATSIALQTSTTGTSSTDGLTLEVDGVNGYLYNYENAPIFIGTNNITRFTVKAAGQVNFTGLASDPAGAAGDVVYNSTSNRLKYHNGTAWVDSGTRKVSVVGGAGTGTYIDATHNFNTKTVSVTVLRTTDNVVVYTDVAMTNDNTVTVTFASSVTLADYTVTVIG